jgi:hypothetical protein
MESGSPLRYNPRPQRLKASKGRERNSEIEDEANRRSGAIRRCD